MMQQYLTCKRNTPLNCCDNWPDKSRHVENNSFRDPWDWSETGNKHQPKINKQKKKNKKQNLN